MTIQSPASSVPDARVKRVAEALYALLPAHIRLRDSLDGGLALRALFEVLGQASAETDAEIDRFHDALFVETADPAALSAIAALVASPVLRPVPGAAGGSERALIANTIRYRRAKGTARVIEDLAADVTGLAAVAVEYYQRIARLAHLIDPRPDRPGTADLRDGQTASRAGRAFDRAARLVDLRPLTGRRPGGPQGRHGLAAVGVHVLRPVVPVFPAADTPSPSAAELAALPAMRPWVTGGTAHPGYFQLSPWPGERVRLFNPSRLADVAQDRPGETDLPDRLQRLPLDRETSELRQAALEGRPLRLPARPWFDGTGRPFAIYVRRIGDTAFSLVPPAQIRIANLEAPPSPAATRQPATLTHDWFTDGPVTATQNSAAHPIACAFDPVTGRAIIAAPGVGTADVAEVRVAHGFGLCRPIGAGPQDRAEAGVLFEVRDGEGLSHVIRWVDATATATGSPADARRTVPDLATALAEVGTLGFGRRSLIICTRSDLYVPASPATEFVLPVHAESEVHLVAAEWRAPESGPDAPPDPPLGFIVRRERRATLDAPLRIERAPGNPGKAAGRLLIDGLAFTQGLVLGAGCLSDLDLRHVTLRRPGQVALAATGAITPLRVTCSASILGPVRLPGGTAAVRGDLTLTDSLVVADGASGDCLGLPAMEAALCNVTVLGTAAARALSATNGLFGDIVTVTRRQSGCLRYSFIPDGSKVPRTFRCQPDLALAAAREAKGSDLTSAEANSVRLSVRPVLMDEALDEPTVAMLHALCPAAIREGGEGGAEIGVFANAAWGLVRANLESLFAEFLPHVLDGVVIDDSQSGAVAQRRNRP
jgi:hypothetical protein